MAGKPITIEFIAEVAQYLRDTKKLEVSTEDIADALNHVSTESADLERKLAKAMKSAEKDVESLERVIKDLPKATEKAADAAKKDFDRVGDAGKDAGREVGDEFRQNLGESLASGNLEDIVSDTLGGLVGSMSGPFAAPAVAGAAIAAYLWNAFRKNEEAKAQAVAGVFEAMDEVTGLIDKRARLDTFITDYGGGDLAKGLARIRQEADTLKISVEDYTAVISGQMTPETKNLYQALSDERDELLRLQSSTIPLTKAQRDRLDVLSDLIGETDKQRAATEQARRAYQDYQNILGGGVPSGPVQLSALMAGIRDDAEQTNYVLDQINRKKLEKKSLVINVTGVDRGNRPVNPFNLRYE